MNLDYELHDTPESRLNHARFAARFMREEKWYLRRMNPTNAIVLVKTRKPITTYGIADVPCANPAAILKIFREVLYPIGIVFEI